MTIQSIFERYEVPQKVQGEAFEKASLALSLRQAWVGPDVKWQVVLTALLFCSLGDKETSAHIRKKVGLDKYAATLIARGIPSYIDTIVASHDWHQKIYVYCLWLHDEAVQKKHLKEWVQLAEEVESQTFGGLSDNTSLSARMIDELAAMEFYHYKNPSV